MYYAITDIKHRPLRVEYRPDGRPTPAEEWYGNNRKRQLGEACPFVASRGYEKAEMAESYLKED